MYLFAKEACIPMRAEPRESAEMVSQLLFGDVVEGFERVGNWIRIQNIEDKYQGWVTFYMLTEISEKALWDITGWQYVHSPDSCLELEDGTLLRLPLGARLPTFQQFENETGKIFQVGNQKWRLRNNGLFKILPPDLLPVTAKKFLNSPYLWGGKGSFGLDCSGFVQTVFRMHGIALLRDASQQATQGETISQANVKMGDLAFFAKLQTEKITHVGIFLNSEEIIHCSGKVRVDKLNLIGSYTYESEVNTSYLFTIKRYF